MKWSKEEPTQEGFYWVRCSNDGKLCGWEDETDIVVQVWNAFDAESFTIMQAGGDEMFDIKDSELGIVYWSDKPIEIPEGKTIQ